MTDVFTNLLTDDALTCVVYHLLDGLFPLGDRGVEHPNGNMFVAYGRLPGTASPPQDTPDCITIEMVGFIEVAEQHTLFVPSHDTLGRPVLHISGLGMSGSRHVHNLQQEALKHLTRFAAVSKSMRTRILPLWRNIYWYVVALYNDLEEGFDRWIIPAYTMPLRHGQADPTVAPPVDIRDPEWFRLAVHGLCAQWPVRARKHIDMEEAKDVEYDSSRVYIEKGTHNVWSGYALKRQYCNINNELPPAILANYYTLWDTLEGKWEYADATEIDEAIQRYESIMEKETAIQDELMARASMARHGDQQ